MEITTEPQTAIEGNNVTLTCWAARYLYTDLQWLNSRNETLNNSSLQLSRYSISLSLHLYNVHQNSTSVYKCQAYKLHGNVELKTVSLIVAGKINYMTVFLLSIFFTDDFLSKQDSHSIHIFFIIFFCYSKKTPMAESKSY